MKKSHLSGIVLSLALALTMGCDVGMNQLDPEPQPQTQPEPQSQSAGIRSIVVSGYQLDGGFSPDRERFSVFVDRPVVSLTAEADTPQASVRYSVANPASIALNEGRNTILVRVEGGKSYELDIWRCNATADTVDSMAGSVLDIPVSYKVYEGNQLVYSIETGSAKSQPLYFADRISYRIVAGARGRASNALENYIRTKESTRLSFICQSHEQPTFAAEAPRVLSLAWTSDAASELDLKRADLEWHEFEEGELLDLQAIDFVKVELSSAAEADETSLSGTGIKLDFDSVPGSLSGFSPAEVDSTMDGEGRFRTTALFDLRRFDIVDGRHSVTVTAYDRANNRVRRDVRFISMSGLPEAGASLADRCVIDGFAANAAVWGTSLELFGVNPRARSIQSGEQGPVTGMVQLNFSVKDKKTKALEPLLGFHVHRSEDAGSSFTYVGTEHFGSMGPDQDTSYWDTDSRLEIGKGYVYKVTAFTEAGKSNEISAISAPVMLMPSFTLDLASPLDGAHLPAGKAPTLKFRISEPELWNPSVSDSFNFCPVIKDKTGSWKFYAMFKYDLVNRVLLRYSLDRVGGDWVEFASGERVKEFLAFDSSRGIVTLNPGLFVGACNLNGGDFLLQSGVAYEWNIIGNWWGAEAPYFYAVRSADSGIQDSPYLSMSSSSADSYWRGYDSTNGWFELIAD